MEQVFSWLFQKEKRFFIILLGITFFLRSSSFYTTFLDIDESQFAGFAHVLMGGGLPYRDSVDTKPPLIYLFYALCFTLFGKYRMEGVHLVTILWSFGTSYVLYKIAKENDSAKSGFFAALFYTLFSTTYLPKFIAANITSIMVLPLCLSVLYWLRGEKGFHLKYDFIAGLFVGVAFLFKYQAGIQGAIFLTMLMPFFTFRMGEFSVSLIRMGILIAGFLLPPLLCGVLLWGLGVWGDFVQWSLVGSLSYIQAGGETIDLYKNFILRVGSFVLATILIWILTIRSMTIKPVQKTPYTVLTIVWLALSFIPVFLGGRFYGHYFIQLLPPLCIMAGRAAAYFFKEKLLRWATVLILVPALSFWMLRINQKPVYALFPDDQLFEQETVGEWMRQHSEPGDTLFVWGFATAIYFHSQRTPASRFLWTDLLTGKVPRSIKATRPQFATDKYIVPEAWEALWEDFEDPPTYFIDTSPADFHHYRKYPITKYPELFQYVQDNYRFMTSIEGCAIYKRKN